MKNVSVKMPSINAVFELICFLFPVYWLYFFPQDFHYRSNWDVEHLQKLMSMKRPNCEDTCIGYIRPSHTGRWRNKKWTWPSIQIVFRMGYKLSLKSKAVEDNLRTSGTECPYIVLWRSIAHKAPHIMLTITGLLWIKLLEFSLTALWQLPISLWRYFWRSDDPELR